MHFLIAFTVSLFMAVVSIKANAGAPVVDLTSKLQGGSNTAKQQYVQGNVDQGDKRVKQQINNLVDMDLPGQIDALRDKVQNLQGRVDVLEHKLQQLQADQKHHYQELARRISGEANAQASNQQKLTSQKAQSVNDSVAQKEAQLYQKAYVALQKHNYDEAIQLFQSFIRQYPDSQYTANVHYWLGELYYVQGGSAEAQEELNTVINDFSDSAKVAPAKLKLALIAVDEDRVQQAKSRLQTIIAEHPNSSAAKLAKRYLNQLTGDVTS
jgi:tol-pal system protein YbgF